VTNLDGVIVGRELGPEFTFVPGDDGTVQVRVKLGDNLWQSPDGAIHAFPARFRAVSYADVVTFFTLAVTVGICGYVLWLKADQWGMAWGHWVALVVAVSVTAGWAAATVWRSRFDHKRRY
jgi:hypothetical protein